MLSALVRWLRDSQQMRETTAWRLFRWSFDGRFQLVDDGAVRHLYSTNIFASRGFRSGFSIQPSGLDRRQRVRRLRRASGGTPNRFARSLGVWYGPSPPTGGLTNSRPSAVSSIAWATSSQACARRSACAFARDLGASGRAGWKYSRPKRLSSPPPSGPCTKFPSLLRVMVAMCPPTRSRNRFAAQTHAYRRRVLPRHGIAVPAGVVVLHKLAQFPPWWQHTSPVRFENQISCLIIEVDVGGLRRPILTRQLSQA